MSNADDAALPKYEVRAVSVGEAFPLEQARVRELLGLYKTIPTGGFGAMMIEQVLRRADLAAISGDPIAILRAYEELKGCE